MNYFYLWFQILINFSSFISFHKLSLIKYFTPYCYNNNSAITEINQKQTESIKQLNWMSSVSIDLISVWIDFIAEFAAILLIIHSSFISIRLVYFPFNSNLLIWFHSSSNLFLPLIPFQLQTSLFIQFLLHSAFFSFIPSPFAH